jgi:hypothetical protein
MRIGRKIIITVILAFSAVGSILAVSQGRPLTIADGPFQVQIALSSVTIVDGPVHVQITLSSASPNTRYYLARGLRAAADSNTACRRFNLAAGRRLFRIKHRKCRRRDRATGGHGAAAR